MAAPVTPAELKACISDPSATMCSNFINTVLKLPVLIYKLFNWMLDSSGNVTQEFSRAASRAGKAGDLVFSAAPLAQDASRLLCNGNEVTKADYLDLYAAIGDTYGTPSDGDHFKLPDFRAKFPLAIGTLPMSGSTVVLGGSGGLERVTLTANESGLRQHSHTYSGGGAFLSDAGAVSIPAQSTSSTAAAGQLNAQDSHLNMPPWFATYVYILT